MSDYSTTSTEFADQNTTSVEAIKARIAAINSQELETHSEEYEAVHAALQRALAEIDGI